MKKILVVTTKFPFPLFSGDKLRIYNIFKYLSKKKQSRFNLYRTKREL